MKNVALVTALILILSVTAEARLGETVKECKERYGPPLEEEVSQKGLTNTYRKGDFVVTVEFGRRKHWVFFKTMKAVAITYAKLTPGTRTRHEPLSDEELGTFLEVNMQGEGWKDVNMMMEVARRASNEDQARLIKYAEKHMMWRRTDGGRAIYDKEAFKLTIKPPREEESSDEPGKGHPLSGF